jgi:hypothetical protein
MFSDILSLASQAQLSQIVTSRCDSASGEKGSGKKWWWVVMMMCFFCCFFYVTTFSRFFASFLSVLFFFGRSLGDCNGISSMTKCDVIHLYSIFLKYDVGVFF